MSCKIILSSPKLATSSIRPLTFPQYSSKRILPFLLTSMDPTVLTKIPALQP